MLQAYRFALDPTPSGLVGRVAAGDARVMSAAVRFASGRWFVSFTVDLGRPATKPAHPDEVVGVDLGIKTLAVLSTGVHIPNPRHLNGALRKVRRLSRRVSRRIGPYDPATKARRPTSNRWRRASAALVGEGVLDLPAKRQPGTAQAGQAGTVQPQGRTALSEPTNAH